MAKFFDRLTQSCQSGASAAVAALLVAAVPAGAQPAWAHQAPGFQSNGAIAVKSLAGGAYGGTENPAGAVAKANQSAVTQPPTVIIQATASLPIKGVGDPCTSSTTGTAAAPTAAEGTAILADRSALLTCQSGVWTATISQGQKYDCMIDANYPMELCINKANGFMTMTVNGGSKQTMAMGNTWPLGWSQSNTMCSASSLYTGNAGAVQCTNVKSLIMCKFSLQWGPYNWSNCINLS